MSRPCNCPGINPKECDRILHPDRSKWTPRQHQEWSFLVAMQKYPELWDPAHKDFDNETVVDSSWKAMLTLAQDLFKDITSVRTATAEDLEDFFQQMVVQVAVNSNYFEKRMVRGMAALEYIQEKSPNHLEFTMKMRAAVTPPAGLKGLKGPRELGEDSGRLFDGTEICFSDITYDELTDLKRDAAADQKKWEEWVEMRAKEKMTRKEKNAFLWQQILARMVYTNIRDLDVIDRMLKLEFEELEGED